jgi:hypothetical protein
MCELEMKGITKKQKERRGRREKRRKGRTRQDNTTSDLNVLILDRGGQQTFTPSLTTAATRIYLFDYLSITTQFVSLFSCQSFK